MSARPTIKRGDIIRKTWARCDFFGTAMTTEQEASRLRVRVDWHPDLGTWEDPGDLTVIGQTQMMTAARHK